jgi:aminopeptidase N
MDTDEQNESNNLVRSGGFDPFDGAVCLQWSEGACVDQILRLFHAQMDGTITPEGKRFISLNVFPHDYICRANKSLVS